MTVKSGVFVCKHKHEMTAAETVANIFEISELSKLERRLAQYRVTDHNFFS